MSTLPKPGMTVTSTQAHRVLRWPMLLQRAARAALDHDALTVAQATAYSAIVALFPGLVVAAAVVALLPETVPWRLQMALVFDRILPANVSPVLEMYFVNSHGSPRTAQALAGAAVVSVTGAANVMATLMEGFRRAHHLALRKGDFWPRRLRAVALVPLSLIPMAVASLLVVFGHVMTHWLAGEVPVRLRLSVMVVAFVLRWTISLAGSVGIIAVIYHLGTDISTGMREHIEPLLALRMDWSWRSSLPGATVGTMLWLVTTLLFGLYVTRFANYSQIYGSLGAAIALLFWLYLIALSVLIGSEFNAQLLAERRNRQKLAFAATTQTAVPSDR